MATYGLGTAGHVPWSGYSNTLGVGAANADATAGYVYFNGIQQGDDRIVKMLRNGGATMGATQILYALLGAAVGALAVRQKKQIKWEVGSPGGLIPIETINTVNRVTNANDLAAYQALVQRVVQPSTYPPDLSGNGGGGKQQIGGGAF
jgi:hypothetical protein